MKKLFLIIAVIVLTIQGFAQNANTNASNTRAKELLNAMPYISIPHLTVAVLIIACTLTPTAAWLRRNHFIQ